MSAFERLPEDYRRQCEIVAMGPLFRPLRGKISPQSRRVRLHVDLSRANAKSFPNRDTRQQRRAAGKPWKAKP